VVRTTRLLSSSSHVNIIGSFGHVSPASPVEQAAWSTIGMISSVNKALPINGALNTLRWLVPFPGAAPGVGSNLTAVPSAISVQVMNANPLQTTEGIVAGAVCPVQLDLRGRTDTWQEFGDEVVSYMKPRLMSAGKLALRGVQADGYPLNMSEISNFKHVRFIGDDTTTLDTANALQQLGWSPIVIVNEGSSLTPALELKFLITIEWRVRFDMSNPAVSSHQYHPVATDADWGKMIEGAVSRASGMMDIVEKVANAGTALASAARPLLKA
jgi:hypothetical protein